jgi:hypothetical protein
MDNVAFWGTVSDGEQVVATFGADVLEFTTNLVGLYGGECYDSDSDSDDDKCGDGTQLIFHLHGTILC